MTQPGAVLRQTCNYLGVDSGYTFMSEIPKENATVLPRYLYLQWLGRQTIKPISRRLWTVLQNYNRRQGAYPPLSEEMQAELAAYFAPYNQELSEITGLNLSAWKQKKGAVGP